MAAERNKPDIDYDGRIYVRPAVRGVTMIDLDGSPELDELIEAAVAEQHGSVSGWTGRAHVRVEILDELPGRDGRTSELT